MLIRINYSHNRAVCRRVFPLERKARFLSAAPENQLANTGACGIDRDQRLALRREIFIERLNDEQLAAVERIIFDRSDYGSDYARELHIKQIEFEVRSPESEVKTGADSGLLDSRLRTHDV